jgi:DNA-directed RNA polymerase delta subunit
MDVCTDHSWTLCSRLSFDQVKEEIKNKENTTKVKHK